MANLPNKPNVNLQAVISRLRHTPDRFYNLFIRLILFLTGSKNIAGFAMPDRYLIAVLLVAIATLFFLFIPAESLLAQTSFYVFFSAVFLASLYGGMRAGLVATLAGVLAQNYFVLPTGSLFVPETLTQNLQNILFIFQGAVLSFMGAILRTVVRKSKQDDIIIKSQDRELQLYHERLNAALRNSPIGIAYQDNQLRYLWAHNKKFDTIYFLGKTDWELWSTKDAQKLTAVKEQVLKTGASVCQEVEVHIEGQAVCWDLTVEPWHDEQGKIGGVISISFDVTSRKKVKNDLVAREQELRRAKEELEQRVQERTKQLIGVNEALQKQIIEREISRSKLHKSEQQLAAAQALAQIGSWEWDLETDELNWSNQLYRLYGLDPETAKVDLETFSNHVHPDDRGKVQKTIELALKKHQPFSFEHRIVRTDGQIRIIDARGEPVIENTKAVKMIGTGQDITEQKELEIQREVLVSTASHELKTPLTTIKGYNQLLQKLLAEGSDSRPKLFLRKMDEQIDRLTYLVNDLLDVSNIRSGKIKYQKEQIDLNEVVKSVSEDLNRINGTSSINLKTNGPAYILADRKRMEQVVANLLTNAVKYSLEGGDVMVKISKNFDKVTIEVSDSGIGIPQESQEKIFDLFYRVDGKHRTTIPGFGLGLYIASEIIKNHNGRIWVESAVGKGSSFYFELPLNR